MNAAQRMRPGHTAWTLVSLGCLCLALPFTLGGCMNLTGLGGSSDYACKAPLSVSCDSVSGTYANAIHNNLPSQRARSARRVDAAIPGDVGAAARNGSAGPQPMAATTTTAAPAALNTPLRSSARILRLWFKPWEDADHDLYDQGYVYVQIDAGQWQIEHVQRQIRAAYAPLRPPPKSGKAASAAPTEDAREPTTTSMRPTLLPRQSPDTGPVLPPFGATAEGSD